MMSSSQLSRKTIQIRLCCSRSRQTWMVSQLMGYSVLLIMLDLNTAFNTLDHVTLLRRLETMGIKGTTHKWLQSNLSNWYQKVDLQNAMSERVVLSTGISHFGLFPPPHEHIHDINGHGYADGSYMYNRQKFRNPWQSVGGCC